MITQPWHNHTKLFLLTRFQTVAYLRIQQLRNNVNIDLKSCFWSHGECFGQLNYLAVSLLNGPLCLAVTCACVTTASGSSSSLIDSPNRMYGFFFFFFYNLKANSNSLLVDRPNTKFGKCKRSVYSCLLYLKKGKEIGRNKGNVFEILDYFCISTVFLTLATALRKEFLQNTCDTCVHLSATFSGESIIFLWAVDNGQGTKILPSAQENFLGSWKIPAVERVFITQKSALSQTRKTKSHLHRTQLHFQTHLSGSFLQCLPILRSKSIRQVYIPAP